jgi:hypothetical protein
MFQGCAAAVLAYFTNTTECSSAVQLSITGFRVTEAAVHDHEFLSSNHATRALMQQPIWREEMGW